MKRSFGLRLVLSWMLWQLTGAFHVNHQATRMQTKLHHYKTAEDFFHEIELAMEASQQVYEAQESGKVVATHPFFGYTTPSIVQKAAEEFLASKLGNLPKSLFEDSKKFGIMSGVTNTKSEGFLSKYGEYLSTYNEPAQKPEKSEFFEKLATKNLGVVVATDFYDRDTTSGPGSSNIFPFSEHGQPKQETTIEVGGPLYVIYHSKDDKRIVVAFRGTVDLNEWLINAKAYPITVVNPWSVDLSYFKVHSGFFEYLMNKGSRKAATYEDVLASVRGELKKLSPKVRSQYKVTVTGHSLGGAMACGMAIAMAVGRSDVIIPLPVSCISFGAPRIGDEDFCNIFSDFMEQGKISHLRVTNEGDIVPDVPPSSWAYQHVGDEMNLLSEKPYFKVIKCEDQKVTSWLSAGWAIVWSWITLKLFIPHKDTTYKKRLVQARIKTFEGPSPDDILREHDLIL